jgi:glutamine amidotransferase
MKIGLIDHGVSNVDSIFRALELCGAQVIRVSNPDLINDVDKIVLPGVGAFDIAMNSLSNLGLTDAIKEAVLVKHKPILGICLGMQLLMSGSDEGVPTPGLDFIPGVVARIKPAKGERVPHVGWNELQIIKQSNILSDDMNGKDFYFVHSYCVKVADEAHLLATTPYGETIQSVIGFEHIYGTQFHPEKSQKFGLKILEQFIEAG